MDVRITLFTAWLALFTAPIALVIGHLGMHNFSWIRNQISTYAALAPNGDWITAGMLLAALALLCLGISISFRRAFGSKVLSHIASMVFGIAVSGLLILAYFRETAMNMQQLKKMGFEAVRQQTFHDAGLLLFFYSSVLAMVISGLVVVWQGSSWARRVLGGVIAATGPAAYAALITSWPRYAGFSGMDVGVRQRGAFLCLWVGALLLLALVTKTSVKHNGS
ncbi:MAG TPA: DUF998 domain-containing protein [Acidiferrobacterales bacterium]|nr:DUF998 domain-containing protein [Acidiferrobacterales bacterium]